MKIFLKLSNQLKFVKWGWLLASLLLSFSACSQPTYHFRDLQGHEISTADWQGKWVIINYWASWCEACAEEIPQLNLFYERNQNQVVLLGVNYENLSTNNLAAAVRSLNIRFPVLQTNPGKALGLPGFDVIPVTFIIDPQGRLTQQLLGPQTAAKLEGFIHAG